MTKKKIRKMLIFKSEKIFVCIFFSLLLVSIDVRAVENQQPVRMLVLSAGDIGIDDNLKEPGIYGIDYRMLPFSKWDLIPVIGFVYKDGGASYTYVDLRYDYQLSKSWVLVPSYGVGYFNSDDETDLGGELEFRAGVDISYKFDNDYRLGLVLFHLSNGKIYSRNPGIEALAIALSIPLHDQ